MAEHHPIRHPSTASRHSGERRDPVHGLNPDIFSDDFALDELAVADGFQPCQREMPAVGPRTPPRSVARRSLSLQAAAETPSDSPKKAKIPPAKRMSVSRPAGQDCRRTPSIASATALSESASTQRPLSTLSSINIPRTQSPYQGATGPSHPYAMYPQDIGLARASTGSTIRSPERAFAGSSGPTHPYGMYAQNTLPEGDVAPVAHAAPIAQVGFPGLAAHEYTRHQNPDGEDADDIIGPDGHTEQLPPYTRYPDAAPKERYASAASESSEALHITLPTSQVVNGPVSPNESIESEDNGHQINLAAAAAAAGLASNRGTRERWSEKSKRRTCCGRMPRWAVILLLILLVVVAATAGGVIGRYLKHAAAKHPDDPSPSSPSSASASATPSITDAMPDARPLPSANVRPQLVSGDWGVPLYTPTGVSTGCLQNQDQSPAWACTKDAYLNMDVNAAPGQGYLSYVTLSSDLWPAQPFQYGPQPPFLKHPATLSPVMDLDDLEKGPAAAFAGFYDKLVILPDNAIAPGSPSRRSFDDITFDFARRDNDDHHRKTFAASGTSPWFCYWNSTMVEGFIYLGVNITTISPSNATTLVNGLEAAASATPTPTGSATSLGRDSAPPVYPRVVKIQERRIPNPPVKPYCQQMRVLDSGGVNPVPNAAGQPIIISLDEMEAPAPTAVTSAGQSPYWKRDSVSCHCEWTSF